MTAVNVGSPFSAGSVTTFMASSLPQDVDPQLKSPYDAIALFSHACMTAIGCRLLGLGEDHKIARPAGSPDQQLPPEWNASTSYAFRYAHSQSSMEYLLKVNRLGSKAVIFGMAVGADKTASFDIAVKDFVSESSFPFSKSPPSQHTFQDIFISVGRVADLAALFKINIVQKLIPGLQKEGYEDTAVENTTQGESSRSNNSTPQQNRDPRRPPHQDPLRDDPYPPARPHPFDDPLAAQPRRPYPAGDFPPPGFEDEYEMNRPPRPGPEFGGIRNPVNIGENDLYPAGLGPHDPLRGSFGPGGGLPRPGGGGGMHPTFDDPMFGGGGMGQGGYDSRAPPGARYDPVGPGDEPQGLRGGPRFPGGPGGPRGGGGPPNPFGGFGGGDFI
ncbi:MAG: hypothetical protein M1835_005012 [Candelina submexicana]|nr:MAG: hypothetical protein M1835_005012 [Candelina submexicana]